MATITAETLAQWFDHSLSPNPLLRRPAEQSLASSSSSPGFSFALLQLIAAPNLPDPLRLAAAVHFKNHLSSHWDPLSEDPITEHEKQLIKSLLLSFILAAPQHVKPHLLDSLSVVSYHDLPHHWPTLLPDIVKFLRDDYYDHYPSINNLLSAANSLFRKFRHSFDDYDYSLKYCLDYFADSLLNTFLKTSRLIASDVAGSPEVLCPLFECQRLCCEIFHSLSSVELPEFFKDHMEEWVTGFVAFFATSYSPEVEAQGTVDALRTSVCQIFQLFLHKNDEDAFFNAYLSDFLSTLQTFLMSSGSSHSHNHMTLTAIEFLTAVSTSAHDALLGSHHVIADICQSIVFPNVKISEEFEELFVTDYLEYARRDIEGSNVDSKRRIACELLKGIAFNYKELVRALMRRHIENSRNLYCANPAEYWKKKDSCIYLVVALAPVLRDSSLSDLVDLDRFYTDFIAPELKAYEVNSFPMVKASALKFFIVFRERIPDTEVLLRLGDIARFLVSGSNVVLSYAAKCIGNLLVLEDKVNIAGADVAAFSRKYRAADINPFLRLLMQNLFGALKRPESQENPYIMKCIGSVLRVGDITGDTAKVCIFELSDVLAQACKNQRAQLSTITC